MTVQANKNFFSVSEFETRFTLSNLLSLSTTRHIVDVRKERFNLAIRLNENAEIDRCFLVNKGHIKGAELHYVTKNGIIFIFNQESMRFITVLIARPNQVNRLYRDCDLPLERSILSRCASYSLNGYNK